MLSQARYNPVMVYAITLAVMIASISISGCHQKVTNIPGNPDDIQRSLQGRDEYDHQRCEPGYAFMRLGETAELCIAYKHPQPTVSP